MPEIGIPFSGLAKDRKLTDVELIRAIKFMEAAEFEATQLYTQLAGTSLNKPAIKIFKDAADEARAHAEEFLLLLHEHATDEEMLVLPSRELYEASLPMAL